MPPDRNTRRSPPPSARSHRISPALPAARRGLTYAPPYICLRVYLSLRRCRYICQGIYMKGQIGQLETVLKALADGTRLRILGLLTTGEVCVCHIHESLKISQPKASRHLAYLRRAGLVTTRREGLWVHYQLGARRRSARRHDSAGGHARVGARGCRPEGCAASAAPDRLLPADRGRSAGVCLLCYCQPRTKTHGVSRSAPVAQQLVELGRGR